MCLHARRLQMQARGSPVRLGQLVDALYNSGWWWCRVVSFNAASVTVKVLHVSRAMQPPGMPEQGTRTVAAAAVPPHTLPSPSFPRLVWLCAGGRAEDPAARRHAPERSVALAAARQRVGGSERPCRCAPGGARPGGEAVLRCTAVVCHRSPARGEACLGGAGHSRCWMHCARAVAALFGCAAVPL